MLESRWGFGALAILVGVLGFFGGQVLAQNLEPDATVTLDCAEGDLVYSLISEIGDEVMDGPSAARAALTELLRRDYPRMDPNGFQESPGSGMDVDGDGRRDSRFTLDEDGDGRPSVVVGVQEVGDSWLISDLSACNSVLVASRPEEAP